MAVLFKNVRYLTPDFQVQEGFVGVRSESFPVPKVSTITEVGCATPIA